ncbi:hypothetical protein [Streptomyces sp. NPDC057582]|uniref:hypothetical protein n=1 Tax=Streptomyces sp. NPDC057582 TaxID=3346174 RepID=UPI00367EEDCD
MGFPSGLVPGVDGVALLLEPAYSPQDDRFARNRNTGPGAGSTSSDRPQLTDDQATGQEIADWLGSWTPSAS